MRSQGLRAWVQRVAVEANTTARLTPRSHDEQPARLAGLLADPSAVHAVEPTIDASDASTGCTISSDDDPGASGSASLRRLRVRLHDAAPAQPIGAGEHDDRPGRVGLGRVEGGALDAQLPAGHARLEREPRQHRARRPARARRVAGNTILGNGGPGATTVAGTFLGSSDIEGFQAANFLQILDNQAEQWLTR
jgi:hypothetical protein